MSQAYIDIIKRNYEKKADGKYGRSVQFQPGETDAQLKGRLSDSVEETLLFFKMAGVKKWTEPVYLRNSKEFGENSFGYIIYTLPGDPQ